MKRVVITGIGAVTPLGNTFLQSWEALNAGTSGIAPITKFDASRLPWRIAGEIRGFEPGQYLTQKEINRLDPFVQYAVAASVMAVEDAGLLNSNKLQVTSSEPDDKDLPLVSRHSSLSHAGVIIGSSRGGITTIEKEFQKLDASRLTPHASRISPCLMPSTTISMAASYVAQKLGIKGHCLGVSNACASGTNAIGEAFRLIKAGYHQIVLAGGTEAPVCRLCIEGYGIAGALSKQEAAPKPFDAKRDGFVLAEGACVLVIEDYEYALKRGAVAYGEITGYGNTTDAYHITRPDAGGEARAIMLSLKEACINPDEVDFINTHGTGTKTGDIAETEAINMVFGKRAFRIPATAAKSMTGHMLAASGAFEAAATLMSIRQGVIPPTINLSEKDPECDINISAEKTNGDIKTAISNSFGFGGVNAVITLSAVRSNG